MAITVPIASPADAGAPPASTIRDRVAALTGGLLAAAQLRVGDVLVVGCSTSEILGRQIGKGSDVSVAEQVMDGLLDAMNRFGDPYLAVQCCQHLNRALVVERECADRHDLEEVTVIPVPHAGGPLAATAMRRFQHPVVVEAIRAHAGIDIGDTLVGMHLRPVVIPVRLPDAAVGAAHVTLARTRPKLIGGPRAQYPEQGA